ncbi:MAG: GNAT family N-acetyltransferase [Gemmatimonadaceae bacterium]
MAEIQDSHCSIRIRAATATDMRAVIALVNGAFAVETFLEGTRTDESSITEMLGRGEFLVGEDQSGRIIASVFVEIRDNPESTSGYLGMLAVDPARQGEGLGRTLAEAAEDHARVHGCKQMDIDVLSLRTELIPFYSKLGYIETGTALFHPSRPLRAGVECHSIEMSKTL